MIAISKLQRTTGRIRCLKGMATRKKKTSGQNVAEKIKSSYIDAVLTGSDNLSSVYAFAKALKIQESTFYKYYNSFEALESSIWKDWFEATRSTLEQDGTYAEFSVREKLLSFYFTWFEMILTQRSFVTVSLQKFTTPENILKHKPLSELKKVYLQFIEELVKEGGESGEVPKRRDMINKSYPNLFWLQFMFLLKFWKDDTSAEFANTDAAIEKSVNLSMDFIGKGPIDSMVDFAKFIYQQAV